MKQPDHEAALAICQPVMNASAFPEYMNLAAAYLDLRAKAKESLDARNREAKAIMAYDVAKDNYTDPAPEGDLMIETIEYACNADAALRQILEE